MSSVVVWSVPYEQWEADNHEGEQHHFDDQQEAIQSACAMERNKDNPTNVLVYTKNGSGIALNIPV